MNIFCPFASRTASGRRSNNAVASIMTLNNEIESELLGVFSSNGNTTPVENRAYYCCNNNGKSMEGDTASLVY